MSTRQKGKCKEAATRPSLERLGLSKGRCLELRNGCMAGTYSAEMLSRACEDFKFIEPWILQSVTKSKSYDLLEFSLDLGRIPVGRTDFYGYRRKFYHNLDVMLRKERRA